MNIFVIGSMNMDLTVTVPVLPQKGQTVAGEGFFTTAGGKGANQAVACAKSGVVTYMAGCVGQAFGADLIHALQQYGVNTQYVARKGHVSSGVAVILVNNADNRIVIDHGANACVDNALIDEALNSAQAGDYLVVQLEINVSAVEYALKTAKQKGMVTILNPAPACPLSDGVFGYCDYFTPNQTEAQFYMGIYPDGDDSALACCEALLKKGVKNVIVTLGEQGSFAYCGGNVYKQNAFLVKAVDTTAAGDTYIGAFTASLSAGETVPQAMRFATAASALAVTKRGAQVSIPAREEVLAFLKDR